MIIASLVAKFAFEHFRFQDEAAVGHDLLAFLDAFEDLHPSLMLESEFHDALLKLVCAERDENDLVDLRRFAAPRRE